MRERSDDPYKRIADLERSLEHQRQLTELERQRRVAVENQLKTAWRVAIDGPRKLAAPSETT